MSAILSSLGVHWHSLLAQVINFSIVAFVLYKFAIKPALSSLDLRVKKQEEMDSNADLIDKKLAEIEEGRTAVIAQARQESQKLLEETQHSAKQIAEKVKDDAQSEVTRLLSQANQKIEEEREMFYKNLKQDVSALVAVAIEKTVGKYIDSNAQQKMTEEAVSEISRLSK